MPTSPAASGQVPAELADVRGCFDARRYLTGRGYDSRRALFSVHATALCFPTDNRLQGRPAVADGKDAVAGLVLVPQHRRELEQAELQLIAHARAQGITLAELAAVLQCTPAQLDRRYTELRTRWPGYLLPRPDLAGWLPANAAALQAAAAALHQELVEHWSGTAWADKLTELGALLDAGADPAELYWHTFALLRGLLTQAHDDSPVGEALRALVDLATEGFLPGPDTR